MRKKFKENLIIVILFLITFQTPAYAYLEPGSLTMILQFIIAAIAGIVSYVTFYYHKVKKFLLGLFKKDKSN